MTQIYGFRKATAEALIGSISAGAVKDKNGRRGEGPWRFFGKLSTAIDPGDMNGEFTVWDLVKNEATDQVLKDVILPAAATGPAPSGKILGITRCGYTGRWIVDTEYC